MKVKFGDLELAYDFVSSGSYSENSAVLDRSTGRFYWHSEYGDGDEIPEELWESGNALEIPHKNDLDLGKQLVFDFVRTHLPDHFDRVYDIFSRRGAYARYKDFLESKGQIEKWYEFGQKSVERALREWAMDHGIEFEDESSAGGTP